MVNKLRCILLTFFVFAVAQAQDAGQLKGRVVSGKAGVRQAYVINKVTGIETKTQEDGTFAIAAKPGDVLIVYNTKIMVREFKLNAESFKNMPYVISVNYTVAASELEEVIITKYGNVNSESLGIASKHQKRFTPAERRLFEAGYGTIGLNSLINVLTGRIKKLKRALETEKQEFVLEDIKAMYEEEDIQQEFGIPAEKVKGFMYYLVGDAELVVALKAKNKTYADFLILGLSKQYLQLQQEGE